MMLMEAATTKPQTKKNNQPTYVMMVPLMS